MHIANEFARCSKVIVVVDDDIGIQSYMQNLEPMLMLLLLLLRKPMTTMYLPQYPAQCQTIFLIIINDVDEYNVVKLENRIECVCV